MTTTRSATEICLIGNPKSDLNTSCLPTNGQLVMSCVTFFRIFKYCNSKLLQSKTLAQVADREDLSTNYYFSVVASIIDASLGNRESFVLSPSTGRCARSFNRKAISS